MTAVVPLPAEAVRGHDVPRRDRSADGFPPVRRVAPCPLRVVLFVQPHSVTGSRCPRRGSLPRG